MLGEEKCYVSGLAGDRNSDIAFLNINSSAEFSSSVEWW